MIDAVSYSFQLNLTVMKIIGLYPSVKYKNLHRVYANVIFILAMTPVTVLGFMHFLLIENFVSVNYSDFILIAMIFYTFKFLPFIRNNKKIMKCIEYFNNPSYVVTKAQYAKIVEDCVATCRRNSQVFFVGCIAGLLGFIGQVFFQETQKQLPLNVWFPKKYKEIPVMYYSIYFLLILGPAYAVLACGTIDPLIGGLAHHAAAQLQILKESFKHLDEYLINEKDNISSSQNIYERIRTYASRYQDIIDFVSEFQDCFSPVVFSQFTTSVLAIGLCCFQISKMLAIDINFLISLNYLGVMFFQIFFCCYYGTMLIEENSTLSSAIYMSQWYDYSEECKRALLIVMERSEKQMNVTAGKIMDLSLDTFTLVLKRSYQLLAVLKNY